MRILQDLSHHELVQNTKVLVQKEKQITLEILRHLREIDHRKLYLERGVSSLFEFCTKILGYEDGAASRRIASMRLISELPVIEKKIEEGKLSLSSASQAAYFFKAEEKQNGEKLSKETKLGVISKLENKSRRDCEKVLLELSPQNLSVRREQVKPVSESQSKVTVVLDDAVLENLKRIQELASHKLKGGDLASVIAFAAEELVKRLDPERKSAEKNNAVIQVPELERRGKKGVVGGEGSTLISEEESRTEGAAVGEKKELEAREEVSVPRKERLTENVPSRYVPAHVKREVWLRDQGQCQYEDPISKRKCCSRKFLHYDHVKPFALGGETTSRNLRLLCSGHNTLLAQRYFGERKHVWR